MPVSTQATGAGTAQRVGEDLRRAVGGAGAGPGPGGEEPVGGEGGAFVRADPLEDLRPRERPELVRYAIRAGLIGP